MFSSDISKKLNWYVYRLVDPRNGETFYVGKGRGNRVFQHAIGALRDQKEDSIDLKIQRIKDIKSVGLEVCHLIHRHNISSETLAYEIEAAVIDCYPGLTNKVGGHGSEYFGCRHSTELISHYRRNSYKANEPYILISIGKSYEDSSRTVYEAVRGFWRINIPRANRYSLVLAHTQGLVVGAFRAREWLPANPSNFHFLLQALPGRAGFIGTEAEEKTVSRYRERRVPDELRLRGAANPIRFVDA